ncbi:MAG TPA: S9 family peptidase, partial [Chloroflexota bacterium]|nr:S9 family peptidase [Chloroflexota bacterium]
MRTIALSQIVLNGDDIYWIEQRPTERGRNVIVRRTPDGRTADVNPAPHNARTRVHEYGGGAFTVADGVAYFSNYDDQRLYRIDVRGQASPVALTPAVDLRYADGVIDRRRHRFIGVREDHTRGGEAVNSLVSVDLEGDEREGGDVLASGNDFYSSPQLSADGTRLAWLSWNHPNMPWDGTELWTGELDAGGKLRNAQRVGGGLSESVFQPQWSPVGTLYFISDRTGWWNL